MASDFLTDDEVVEYFKFLNPKFVSTDLPSWVRCSAYQQIIQRSGTNWDATTKEILVNGTGTPYLSLYESPVTIEAIIILSHRDANSNIELNVDQESDDKDIVYNAETSLIELLNLETIFTEIYQVGNYGYATACFPKGIQNIKIRGVFGQNADLSCILKQLQLYLMTIMMGKIKPSLYAVGDIVSEKIGKYQVEFYGRSQTKSHRSTLEQLIDDLFAMLPNSMCWGDI